MQGQAHGGVAQRRRGRWQAGQSSARARVLVVAPVTITSPIQPIVPRRMRTDTGNCYCPLPPCLAVAAPMWWHKHTAPSAASVSLLPPVLSRGGASFLLAGKNHPLQQRAPPPAPLLLHPAAAARLPATTTPGPATIHTTPVARPAAGERPAAPSQDGAQCRQQVSAFSSQETTAALCMSLGRWGGEQPPPAATCNRARPDQQPAPVVQPCRRSTGRSP